MAITIHSINAQPDSGFVHVSALTVDINDGDEDSKRLYDLLLELLHKHIARADDRLENAHKEVKGYRPQ